MTEQARWRAARYGQGNRDEVARIARALVEATTQQIAREVIVNTSTARAHLTALAELGVVRRERRGRVFYWVAT